MTKRLLLRAADARDVERIAALHVASWQQHYRGILPDEYLDQRAWDERLTLWRQRFAAASPPWVRLALWYGESVGFVCLLPDEAPERGVYLDNLHVLPGQQGRGVGRALMAAAAAEALRVAPGRPLYLWVYQANHAACGFTARWEAWRRRRARWTPRPAAARWRSAISGMIRPACCSAGLRRRNTWPPHRFTMA